MLGFLRKWHVLLAVVLGVYLIIQKPEDPLLTVGEQWQIPAGTELTTSNGLVISTLVDVEVDRDDDVVKIPADRLTTTVISGEDPVKDGVSQADLAPYTVTMTSALRDRLVQVDAGQFAVKLPWARFKYNLGQDLQGGTSLRYVIKSQAMATAERKLLNLYTTWYKDLDRAQNLPESVKTRLSAFNGQGSPKLPNFNEEEVAAILASGIAQGDQKKAFESAYKGWQEALTQAGAEDYTAPTIEKLTQRLNSSGATELNIVKAGKNEIEVKIPALSNAEKERLKDTLQTTGALEFLLLPPDDVFGDKNAADVFPALPDRNTDWYDWYEVLPSQTAAKLKEDGGLVLQDGILVEKDDAHKSPLFHSKFAHVTDRLSPPVKFTDANGVEHTARIRIEVCLAQVKFRDLDEDAYPISGRYLKDAAPSSDSKSGMPAVSFTLEGRGVAAMETITSRHNSEDNPADTRLLAVSIDRRLYSAATVNSRLSDQIQVTGNFTRDQVKQYIDTLKAGQLPVSLTLVGEETVGPAEGADNIERGIRSLILGALLVFAFAIIFYYGVGILTMLNLSLTIVLILAIMSAFLATLTLPGIAGLVLTLGMAIDANILINERIREEKAAGASGRSAFTAGFDKAMSAILDGNVTTLITAVILTKIGTGAIAGFALTLSIGILCTLYVALLVYRTSMFWCFDRGIITDIRGIEIFKNSSINFVRIGTKVAYVTTAAAIISFGVFLYDAFNHGNVFGIDFRGGTQIVVELKDPASREEVDGLLGAVKNDDGTDRFAGRQLQARTHVGEESADGRFHRWELRFPREGDTADEDLQQAANTIRTELEGVFGSRLVKDGFSTAIVGVTEIDLIARIRVEKPENVLLQDTVNWAETLMGSRWANKDVTSLNWFSSLTSNWVADFETDSSHTFQTLKFSLRGIPVTSADDIRTKRESLYNTLKAKLVDDSDNKEFASVFRAVGGSASFPTFEQASIKALETSGKVRADITLSSPIDLNEVRSVIENVLAGAGPAFNDGGLSITGSADADGKVTTISVTSGETDLVRENENAKPHVEATLDQIKIGLTEYFDEEDLDNLYIVEPFPQVSAIGSRVAGETRGRAALAFVIALIAIVIYIGIRFKSAGWGYAAVLALIHDSAFTLGALALVDLFLFDLKFDLNAVAALLTVIGYSLNDTIVIFDRVREELLIDVNTKRKRMLNVVINDAINKTLSRSVLTSASTMIVVLAMLLFGGPALETFAWVLFFGLFFGTYSSVFRAGPLLMLMTVGKRDLRAEVEAEEAARKEAERAEAEMMAAISVEREVTDEEGGEGQESAGSRS